MAAQTTTAALKTKTAIELKRCEDDLITKENSIEELVMAKKIQELLATYEDIKVLNKTKDALNLQLAKLTTESDDLLARIIKA